jgi:hypothetical protein
MTIEDLIRTLGDIAASGRPSENLKRWERERGTEVIEVGSVSWLPSDDWPSDVVISKLGNDIRIVLIAALEPGSGAFSRLINGIVTAGLRPIVVCPSPEMQSIVSRWGWQCKEVGHNFETYETLFFPSRRWMKIRAARERTRAG